MHLHFMILGLFTFPLAIATGTLNGSSPTAMINNNIAKPGCQTQCGNITVPYPFGIGNDTGCSLDGDRFYLTCQPSSASEDDDLDPHLFVQSSNIRIHNISDTELRILTRVAYRCYDRGYGNISDEYVWWIDMAGLFTFSEKNKFTVIGCDDYGLITGSEADKFSSGCIGLCNEVVDVSDGECSGKGCCQTSISKGLKYYNVSLNSFKNHTDVWPINNCGYAFLGEEGSFKFGGYRDLSSSSDIQERVRSTSFAVLDWVIGQNQSCSKATECKGNSECYDVDGGGYRCRCNQGFQGNPYLDEGCQDIDECRDTTANACYGTCTNTIGSYNCTCPLGSSGDAKTINGCQPIAKKSKFPATIFTIVLVTSLLTMLLGIMGICFGIRRRRLTMLREKFFEQNGGVLLKQKMSSQGSHEAMTLFSTRQLQNATNNYSNEHIIGRGAYGVVYKGVLADKRVVAIKKSKLVDQSQAEQFINEVMILTQVIHRNVVKLLGCCLEEEVPVLVYEFISNNTLFHHIHNTPGGMGWLSWENRLRVASEAASALGYLHSETTIPIIHRDIKSSNILLDENYNTKIADFGASRLVPLDHNQVSTLIMGTLGYLDPEYFHTSQLTDKSDVYSFGVVLAELITGKKPIGVDRSNEEKSLATFFLKAIKENHLFEIVEPRLLREGTLEKVQVVSELVKRCLNAQGCNRPTMREVAMELEGLRKITSHPWVQQHSSAYTQSLILEAEQSDLYDVPLVSFSTNGWESYSGNSPMGFEENKPR